jgi:hypothetical protein
VGRLGANIRMFSSNGFGREGLPKLRKEHNSSSRVRCMEGVERIAEMGGFI